MVSGSTISFNFLVIDPYLFSTVSKGDSGMELPLEIYIKKGESIVVKSPPGTHATMKLVTLLEGIIIN